MKRTKRIAALLVAAGVLVACGSGRGTSSGGEGEDMDELVEALSGLEWRTG